MERGGEHWDNEHINYPGLTEVEFRTYKAASFTKDQLAQLNQTAITQIDARLQSFTPGSPEPITELRLVLLGKTGAGKSSTGNMIIGRNVFKESLRSTSCTATIAEEECFVDGIRVRLIDTPGLFDTDRTAEDILTEIAKVIETFSDGIHGFLFVYSFGNPRFTKEEQQAFESIENGAFGPRFLDHCLIIISHGNEMARSENLDDYLKAEYKSKSYFGHLLNNTVRRRVVAVENTEPTQYGRDKQKQQVVQFITSRVVGVYTNDTLNEFKRHQEETANKFAESIKSFATLIEAELFTELKSLPHQVIKDMSKQQEGAIIESVLEKVMRSEKIVPSMKTDLRKAIGTALTEKRRRLTSPTFLERVKNFLPLLQAAGQIIGPVLQVIAAFILKAVLKR